MIGQRALLTKLNGYTLDTLPSAVLFIGEHGCGKHLFSDYLAKKLHIELVDLTKDFFESDKLIDLQFCPIHKLYRINLDEFTQRQQNQLLKTIEEPPKTAHIVLLSSNEANLLPTIQNRCMRLYFEPYTVAELKQITNINYEYVYNFCHAPGPLMSVSENMLPSMKAFCEQLILYISKASYANTLKNILKINCAEDYTKFDFELLLNMLEYASYESYIQQNNEIAYRMYKVLNQKKQLFVMCEHAPIKENFLVSLFTELWESTHAGFENS